MKIIANQLVRFGLVVSVAFSLASCSQSSSKPAQEAKEATQEEKAVEKELINYYTQEKKEYTTRLGHEIAILDSCTRVLQQNGELAGVKYSAEEVQEKITVFEKQKQDLKNELQQLDEMNHEEWVNFYKEHPDLSKK